MLMSDLCVEILEEVGGDLTDQAALDQIFRFMKSGIRLIPALVRSRVLTTRQSFTLVANSNSYDLTLLSPSFIRERTLSYTDAGGKEVPILELSAKSFIIQKDPTIGAYPSYYNVSNRRVYFDRFASQATVINIDYFCAQSEGLTANTVYFSSEDTVELVKYVTKIKYYEYQQDSEMLASSKGDAKVLMDELESRYIEDELGGTPDESES